MPVYCSNLIQKHFVLPFSSPLFLRVSVSPWFISSYSFVLFVTFVVKIPYAPGRVAIRRIVRARKSF